ncbi:hypothetical protein Rt10032_c02g0681 [Rhodotorula toruloides]|uniref:Uncharacterized protein n=1 Tax=Rhodotorula toruloides TaxID=5286 RepID=A0A511KB63_RHOTO|nr:hypothetical protein Rt10032_c02g0681 [Rhodotorula toruloides]
MAAPEPSPAPTLDDSFPGFYPPTPAPATSDADPSTALDPLTQPHDRIEGAARALLGAAAGFVVGGPVGAAIGGGLAGLSVVEGEGIAKRFGDRAATPTPPSTQNREEKKGDRVDETHRPEFGDEAVEREQAALASSPAQKLVGGDEEEGAKISGTEALGGALLAGAAGAKVEENEVRAPGTTEDEAERKGAVEPATAAAEASPPAPDFGTPAIEKEQAVLAASPAQQLLARTDSTALDEVALLAGAAGAMGAVSNEIEEPAKAPLEVATQRAIRAGAGVPTPSSAAGEGAGGEVFEREARLPSRSTFPSQSHTDDTSSSSPALTLSQGSLTSFTGDVLAAGSGVRTPSEAPGPAVPAAIAGSAAGAALLGTDLVQRNIASPLPSLGPFHPAHVDVPLQPKDFEPYAPPAIEPSVSPVSSAMTDSQQSSASLAYTSTDATEIPPAPVMAHHKTFNAQNVKQETEQLPTEADASVPHARSPEHDQLPAGAGADKEEMVTPMSETIPMQTALEEGPTPLPEEEEAGPKKLDKGKGKEAIGAAALGAAGVGAGVGMKELLEADKDNSAAPASQFREVLDSTNDEPLTTEEGETGASPAGKHDRFDDQRAYPSVPHMMRTDEAIHDSFVGDGKAARRARVIDSKELAAVPATTPEQAGFANVGNEITPAMQDFAHLSMPASQAEQQAINEGAAAPASTDAAAFEPEKDKDSHRGAIAAGAGLAVIGAGVAGADLLSHDHAGAEPAAARAAEGPASARAAELVSTNAASGGVAPPVTEPQAASAAMQTPAKPPRTPVSRFTEETALPSGAETPSSTRAVMGSPPSSVHERSAATTPLVTPGGPTQITTPTQSLFEAGVLEKSPHLKIQTHKVDGHKRLHRKSLSANTAPALVGATRSSHERDRAKQSSPSREARQPSPPVATRQPSPPQAALAAAPVAAAAHPQAHGHGNAAQQHGYTATHQAYGQAGVAPVSTPAASGPTGATGHRPLLDTAASENRRDRLLNSMIGVPDPTMVTAGSAPTTPPQTAVAPSSRTSSDRPASVTTPARKSIEDAGSAVTYQGEPPISTITGITSSHPEGRTMVPEAEVARAHTPIGVAKAPAGTPAAAPAPGATTRAPASTDQTATTPSAPAPARHVVETPSSGSANVHRKLSKAGKVPAKRHPHDGEKEKTGFLSRLFGSSKSKHGRTASGGSAGASPRSSAELQPRA